MSPQERTTFEQLKQLIIAMDPNGEVCQFDEDSIQPDAWLSDSSIDSLIASEYLIEIEEKLGAKIDFFELRELNTWLDLSRLVISRQALPVTV